MESSAVVLLVLLVALGAFVAFLVAWGVFRELSFARIIEKLGGGVAQLSPVLKELEKAVDGVSTELERVREDVGAKHREIAERIQDAKRLTLDVETRVSGLIRDLRGSDKGTQNFFHQSVAEKAQTNQGGRVDGSEQS